MRLGVIIIQCLCLAACHVLFKYTYPGHITSYRRVRFGLNLTALQDVGEYRLIVSCIYSASCSQSLLNVSAVDILGYSTYQLWNFQPTNISFSVAMVSSDPNLPKLESSILSILSGNSDEAYVVAILTQENTAGYILPFNLFPLTSYGVGVVQEMPMLLQPYLETTEPFVSTYWNELQTTTVLLPWIPYFSACSLSTPGLILVDLIKPSDCTIASRVYGQEIVCTDKLQRLQCLVEQLFISPSSEVWYNSLKGILYYLFPNPVAHRELLAYNSSMQSVQGMLADYFDTLVPMVYYRMSSNLTIVNSFEITFKVVVSLDGNYSLVRASIIGTYESTVANGSASVTVSVNYMTFLQSFYCFTADITLYSFANLLILLSIGLLIYSSLTTKVWQSFQRQLVSLLFPIAKGLLFCLCSAYIYVIILYEIVANTGLSLVQATWNGNIIGSALLRNNSGRSGLMLVFAGIFVVNCAINQLFKVPTLEEIKIIFEDDASEKPNSYRSSTHMDNKQRQDFLIKNLYSQRKYFLACSLVACLAIVLIYFMVLYLSDMAIALVTLLLLPAFKKLQTFILRHYVLKDLLCLQAINIALETFLILLIVKADNFLSFTLHYIARTFAFNCGELFLQFIFQIVARKLSQDSQRNWFCSLLASLFHKQLESISAESQYERALYYSSLFTAKIARTMLTPFFVMFLLATLRTSYIAQDLLVDSKELQLMLISLLSWVPFEIGLLLLLIRCFKKLCGVSIEDAVSFNQFKFRRRKLKWMNDYFNHNLNIAPFYRQYEKFYFSSQLYFVSLLLAFGLCVLSLGCKSILSVQYVVYNDPVFLVLTCIVWITGELLSFLASITALKLRLYERRDEEVTRSKLSKIDKYLKRHDYHEYLEVEGVKRHFLLFNKNWIIENLHRILTREDFLEENSRLMKLYKHYESEAKKKQIAKRRIGRESRQPSKQQSGAHMQGQVVIKLPLAKFQKFAKPIFYSWFYIAKQVLYLKGIVERVRREKLKEKCEFCSMDIELEAVEKKEFNDVVNSFRAINVGNIFVEHCFLDFYRHHQEFITVCVECKDRKIYLEKKTIKNARGVASKLMLKWIIAARSNLLHHGINKWRIEGTDPTHRKKEHH